MIKVSFPNIVISSEINAPCSRVWDLIIDTSRWTEWGPSVSGVECRQRYIQMGTTGKIQTAAGFWVTFEITRFEKERSWSWRVSGIPATGHRIESLGDDKCLLTFEVPLVAAPYAAVCRTALKRIHKILEHSPS